MNRAARTMISRGHGLSLRTRRLTFAQASSQAAFEACLAGQSGHLVLRVGGPSTPTVRTACSSVRSERRMPRAGSVCSFTNRPASRAPVPTSILRELYELTAAEARLVNALYVGQSLRSAAGTGGISHNTAKSVLKRVFVKCGVGTQAELLQLLSLGPRTL